ncbi:DUF4034 domain-containing protein [Achromobacter sp. LC458]|uniref:DUF4034 domain-containing protein n=1 Tax=Achromobacter sp. LC458 TaxID=1120623 RepID=UPI00062A209C|nr:DUF4034 domain-containing protein [Achromobacter sp. LC458]TRM50207.1 DUF4034 domain-containing protein [Achromobacter sp. LC458]
MTPSNDTIDTLLARRAQLREWLDAGQYDDLDALLEAAALRWLDSDGESHGYRWMLDVISDPQRAPADNLARVRAWRDARPASYHAHLAYGNQWESIAGLIRSSNIADYVNDAQWAGAMMARDHAVAAFLHAMALHERPVVAVQRTMRVCAYLDEPDWLADLLEHGVAASHDGLQASWAPDVWEQALRLLDERSGMGLAELPASRPDGLPPRTPQDKDDPKTYWLRTSLALRPNDLSALISYLYFLYPRWNGSHADMQAFIDGPVCAGLTDAQREELRFYKELDYLGYPAFYPEVDDDERNGAFCDAFEQWLTLDVSAELQCRALCHYANFQTARARREDDDGDVHWNAGLLQHAYALLTRACAVAPANIDLADDAYPGVLFTLQACVWFQGMPDAQRLFPLVLTRGAHWGDDVEAVLLAAVGSKFGLFGLQVDELDTQALLERGFALDGKDRSFNLAQLGRNLWGDVSPEAALFLWQEGARRQRADALMSLSELYAGKIDANYPGIDKAAARNFLTQAAEAGDLIARNNLAYAAIDEGRDIAAHEYQTYRGWLENNWRVADRGSRMEAMAARNLSWLMLMHSGSEEDQRAALDSVLPWLWNQDHDGDRETAARSYAIAFMEGRGCEANAYLAHVWIARALALSPDNEYLQRLSAEINDASGWFGAWRLRRRLARDRADMDERARELTFAGDDGEGDGGSGSAANAG